MENKLSVKTYLVDDISEPLINKMWQLYDSTYDYVNKEQFISDFKNKNFVFVARDKKTNAFKGFSTVYLYEIKFLNKKYGVIFSGDTIIHPDYWGNRALHLEFFKFAFKWKLKNLHKRLFWNLIASGNKTYLTMARNCNKYYPSFKQETPKWENVFIKKIGRQQFGQKFNLKNGIIEMNKPEAVFKTKLAPFSDEVKKIPEIDFFVRVNKGYHKGDELSCIAEMNASLAVFFCIKSIKKIFKNLKKQRSLVHKASGHY